MERLFISTSIAVLLTSCGNDERPSVGSGCASAACGSTTSTTSSPVATETTAQGSTSAVDTSDSGTPPTSEDGTGSDADSGGDSTTGPMLEPSSARHTPIPLGETESPQGYWEYLPPTWDGQTPHPVLVYLHGIGANGNGTTQLDRVLINGPARLIALDQWPYERPFVVLTPQHPGPGCTGPTQIQEFLTYVLETYPVESGRVHLTGISCGAIGAWDYLSLYFDSQVAAAVLIAGDGRGPFMHAGCGLGATPIWALHGADDNLVDPLGTIEPIEALLACDPPAPVQMTIFEGVRHVSWPPVYDGSAGHDVYAWLLGHG